MSHPDRSQDWDETPAGLLVLDPHGTVLDANATILDWLGRGHDDVAGRVRLSNLLSVGGRIYWETHLSPMLHADGRVDEVALELVTATGRLPVLLSARLRTGPDGPVVRAVLSSAGERSRYERELLAARTEAERAAERTRVLLDVTSALSRAVGMAGVTGALLDQVAGSLGALAATVWVPGDDGALRPYASAGEREGDGGRNGAVDGGGSRDGAVEGAGDPDDDGGALSGPPPVPVAAGTLDDDGRYVVPLLGQSGLHGVLTVVPDHAAVGEQPLLDVLTAVGQQAGLALDRAAMYEQKAGQAHALQHAMLELELPSDERFAVATAYRPGVAGLEVGGDWYDVFPLGPDVLAFVVGDVVGRGLGAAVAMGQLRSAVRALADPEEGPARLLQRLDRFVELVPRAATATVAYAQLDLATGMMRFACAGHLPPVLRRPDGDARLLWEGRSTPLGVVLPGHHRDQAELALGAGDQVLLYSDGLVERRDRSLPAGLEELRAATVDVLRLPPDEAVPRLVRDLLDEREGADDVCLLLLSWRGPAAPRPGA